MDTHDTTGMTPLLEGGEAEIEDISRHLDSNGIAHAVSEAKACSPGG